MLQPAPKKKYVPTAKEKKNLEDASSNKNMRPPFTPEERKKMKNYSNMGKAKSGTSLGMKSVKAGFDKNPGVTRADIITAAKGKAKSGTSMKKAKSGTKMKKAQMGNTMMADPMMKSGGKMKKCKYGCK